MTARGPAPGNARQPESLLDIGKTLLQSLAKSLPRRIVMSAIIFLGVWVLHTYLLVYPNEGFNPNDFGIVGIVLGQILALGGRVAGGTMFWFLLSMLISMAFAATAEKGSGLFSGIGQTPAKIGASFGPTNIASFFGGAATGLVLSALLFNRLDALMIALLCLIAMAHGPQAFLHTVVRCAYNDGRKILSKPKRTLQTAKADSFLGGVVLASAVFMVSIFLPKFLVWAVAIGLLATAVVLATRNTSTVVTSMFGVVAFAFVMGVARQAFGDDGGASEAVGPWITSPGAVIAILMGVPPAAGAALGANLGALVAGNWSDFPGLFGSGPIWGGAGANPNLIHDPVGGAPGDCQEGGLPIYAVDTSDLRFSVSDTLYNPPGALMRPLAHVWNATGAPGPFGRGWNFSYLERIADEGDTLRLTEGSGAVTLFDAPPARGEGAVATQRGGDARMTAWHGGWVITVPGSRMSSHFEPDPAGGFRLSSAYDPDGNVMRLTYDAAGRLVYVTDPANRSYTLGYDAAGHCTTISLPDGRSARYTYTPAGELVGAIDLADVESHYAYDERGLMNQIVVGRKQNTTQIQWIDAPWGPRVAQVTDATGAVTRYDVISDSPREIAVTDPVGRTKRYSSVDGRTTRIVAPSGTAGTIERIDPTVTRVTDPAGGVSTYEEDPAGRWRRETSATGAQRVFQYDEAGFLVSAQNPAGAWAYTYDASHRPVSKTSPGGRRWTYEYDAQGRIVAETDSVGATTRYTYDQFGNTTSFTDASGAVRRIEYDEWGLRPLRAYDPLGNMTTYEYDGNDRQVKITHPDGTFEETIHGCCAPLMERDGAGSSTGVDRDAMLRPTRITDNGRVVDMRYDGSGALVEMSEGNALTRLAYDVDGHVSRIESGGSAQEFTYDAMGRVTWTKDPTGSQRWFSYDADGRPTGETDALGHRSSVEYDAAGRPVRSVDARGNDTRVTFDADGVPLARTVNGVQDAKFLLDAAGELLGFDDPTGSTRLHSNAVGAVTGIDFPDGSAARADLNAAGAVTHFDYPGDFAVDIEVDERNRPKRVAFGKHSVDIAYDAAGRLAEERRSNGVTSAYGYTGNDMTSIEHSAASGVVASAHYQVDRASGRTIMESGHRPVTGSARAVAREMTFDANGGLASLNGAAAATDADGNLTSVDDLLRADYDFANRLTQLERDGEVTTFVYDAFGRRSIETRGDASTTAYRDMQGRLLAEGDGKGEIKAWYVWAENMLLARVDASGEVGFYLGDRQGSTLALVDGAGAVAAAYDYDPWGSIVASSGDVQQPFTWQGRSGVQDEGGGVYSIGPRTYLATAGRFMQRDPAYPATGWNAYAYASGNPVDFVDYTGFDSARSAWNARSRPPAPPKGNTIQTPRGEFRTLSKPEVDEFLNSPHSPMLTLGESGVFNMGAGTIGFGLGAAKLIALAGASATPVGWVAWGAAGLGLILGGARAYAGYNQYQASKNGENHANATDSVLDTADPSRVRRLPGRAYDWVCGMGRSISQSASDARDSIGRGIYQLNQPSTWYNLSGVPGY